MNILEARRRTLGGRTIKRTAAGNPAVAQGSLARRGPGITMQGWTEQDSTTGAQLWDEANESSYDKGARYVFQCEPNTDYTFSTDIQVSSLGVWSDGFNGENLHAVKYNATELTFNSGEYNTLYMQVYEPENPGGIKVMLNAGSAALPYEPYTGGQPSPSPDYPQEIVSAGSWNETAQKWEYEVGLSGANMLDTGNEFPYQSGRRFAFNCIPNTDYTLHSGIVVSSIGVLTNEFTDTNNPYAVVYNSDTLVFNSGNNEILYIQFYSPGVDLDYEVMLNPGSTPLPYTPYRPPQTVTITANRPLTKWDKLTKKNGVWGWEYKSAEAVLDGSEKWSLYPSASVGTVFYTALPNTSSGFQTSLCDKYRNINNVWGDKYNGVFGIYSDHNSEPYKYFRPPSAAVETVEQWKAWLSENPLTLWHETEVETFVPLTTAEQEAMNALHTYRPTTVLTNQQDCQMTLTYKTRKSMEVTT